MQSVPCFKFGTCRAISIEMIVHTRVTAAREADPNMFRTRLSRISPGGFCIVCVSHTCPLLNANRGPEVGTKSTDQSTDHLLKIQLFDVIVCVGVWRLAALAPIETEQTGKGRPRTIEERRWIKSWGDAIPGDFVAHDIVRPQRGGAD